MIAEYIVIAHPYLGPDQRRGRFAPQEIPQCLNYHYLHVHTTLTGFWLYLCEAPDQGGPVSGRLCQEEWYQHCEGGGSGCQ